MLRFVRNFNLMDYRQSLEKVIRFKKFLNKLTLRVTFIVDIFVQSFFALQLFGIVITLRTLSLN